MFYNLKEQKLNLHSMQIDYITFGKGKRNLVMIQGLHTRGIKGTGPSLAFLYRIFAYDYKVHIFGRRPSITNDTTVRDMALDIADGMDLLKIEKADIIGVSQGGMIAQYLAIDRPDLVNKLVLAVTLSKNNDTVQAVVNNWISLTKQGKIKELVKDMAVKMYSEKYIKRYKPFFPLLTILQKPEDDNYFINMAKACLTCNAYDELERIQCPVLVIGGKQDKVLTGTASEEIAKKLKCEIYMYENLGHATYEEAKDFNAKVYHFLRD